MVQTFLSLRPMLKTLVSKSHAIFYISHASFRGLNHRSSSSSISSASYAASRSVYAPRIHAQPPSSIAGGFPSRSLTAPLSSSPARGFSFEVGFLGFLGFSGLSWLVPIIPKIPIIPCHPAKSSSIIYYLSSMPKAKYSLLIIHCPPRRFYKHHKRRAATINVQRTINVRSTYTPSGTTRMASFPSFSLKKYIFFLKKFVGMK